MATEFKMGYAWSQRPSEWRCIGAHHIVLTAPLHIGRLHRAAGDALCKPAAKFYDLDTEVGERRRAAGSKFDCLGCCATAERHGLMDSSEFGETRFRAGSR